MHLAYSQRGLSLIELMVAMLLSMLLLLGATQMFLSSKQSYSANTDLARIQENARFAMDFIGHDLRNAGFKGDCRVAVDVLTGLTALTNLNEPVTPTMAGNSQASHELIIKHANGAEELATPTTAEISGATISVQSFNLEADARHILVSSLDDCELTQISSAPNATTTSLSLNPALGKTYHREITRLLRYSANTYLVDDRALKVRSHNGPAEELVQGIEAIRFTFAEGTGNGANRRADNLGYRTANNVGNWGNVVAVRVQILAIGGQDNVLPENQYYNMALERICSESNRADCGAGAPSIDGRRLAKFFTSTFSLRNQLP